MQKIPRASCVLGSSSCSPADEGKTMEKGANSPKALECRAPSALQQPARVRGFPFLSPSQLLKELIPARAAAPGKSWMFSTGVLVGRRDGQPARAGQCAEGNLLLSSCSLLGPAAQRGWNQGLETPEPACGWELSRSPWLAQHLEAPAGSQDGSWRGEIGVERAAQGGCPVPGWEVTPGGDTG